MKPETEIKVGDTVELIEPYGGYSVGDQFRVVRVYPNKYSEPLLGGNRIGDGKHVGAYLRRFRKVEPEPEFVNLAGHNVRVIANTSGHNFPIGKVVGIERSDPSDNGHLSLVQNNGEQWWLFPGEWELAEVVPDPPVSEPEPELPADAQLAQAVERIAEERVRVAVEQTEQAYTAKLDEVQQAQRATERRAKRDVDRLRDRLESSRDSLRNARDGAKAVGIALDAALARERWARHEITELTNRNTWQAGKIRELSKTDLAEWIDPTDERVTSWGLLRNHPAVSAQDDGERSLVGQVLAALDRSHPFAAAESTGNSSRSDSLPAEVGELAVASFEPSASVAITVAVEPHQLDHVLETARKHGLLPEVHVATPRAD